MNVLIVEDSSSARKLLRITFEHYDCTVIEAEDGEEGVGLAVSTAKETKKDADHKKPAKGTETILLAEDDETVRTMALALLESFGYKVIAAVDGDDAVQKFRENGERIRLLLFDVIMPNKNGITAYDEICEIEPGMKVIFTSGYASDAVHQKMMLDDNVIFISKPYVTATLLATIRSVLDRGTA